MDNVPIFDDVVLSFLLAALHQLVLESRVLDKRVCVDHLRADEPFREVAVDFAPRLDGRLSCPDRPSSNLISPHRVEVAKFQLFIASFDDIGNLRFQLLFGLLLILHRKGDDLRGMLAVVGNSCF